MKRNILLALVLLLPALPLKAQFFSNGDDPSYIRWQTIETPHYQLIYPRGVDSLARSYGRLLEQFRVPMGRSIGTIPGQGQRRKMPVVLHALNAYSNGSVGWAPSRMDLYTLPDANSSDPAPWPLQLAAHEPRHQAQFQSMGKGWFRLFNILSGEAWNPVAWQVFYGWALGEGDAVVAETGLWNGGTRARTADFLNYYRVALDQGDFRNWYRWRYGSYKYVTPDHYAAGYLAVAGTRYLLNQPYILQQTAEQSRKSPLRLSANFRKVVRKNSDGKRFNAVFREILDTVNTWWQADAAARSPFLEDMEQVTPALGVATDYTTQQMDSNGTLFALRKGNLHTSELVAIKDGQIQHVAYLNSSEVSLTYDACKNRLYFTETRTDARWKLSGQSVVAYYDINTGKMQDLASGHRYFNVQVSDDGKILAVAEYLPDGETALVLLSSEDGRELSRLRMPDGIQPSEFGWCGDALYLSAISLEGYGIYRVTPDGKCSEILAPSHQKVTSMGGEKDFLEWVSDRTGVNEVYHFYPAEGRLLQMTNTRYGTTEPCWDDNYLYTISQTREGMLIFRTPRTSLQPREVDYANIHSYPLADALLAQERALGPEPDFSSAVPMSATKRYRKWANPLRLHSWLPLYLNYDAVKNGSMDYSYETASLGLSGYFQNTLGTFSGMVGYSLHPNPDEPASWRNALHAKFTYSGLYPVFEASFSLGDRAARQYFLNERFNGEDRSMDTGVFLTENPLVMASLKTYVPLSWRRFGVNFGFIPQVSYTFSNHGMATDPVQWEAPGHFKGIKGYYKLMDPGTDANVPMQRLAASVRGYVMLSKAANSTYPRLGIGAEVGGNFRPGLGGRFAPNVYGYAYGYLPGLWRSQGLKLTGMVQQQLFREPLVFGEMAVNTLPRGFNDDIGSIIARQFPFQWRVTADYAIPVFVGDLSIPGVAYITHFLLTPHGDYTGFSGGNLWSAGADLTAQLAKLILPFDASLGVSFSWLGGSWYVNTGQEKPWSVSLILGMDF